MNRTHTTTILTIVFLMGVGMLTGCVVASAAKAGLGVGAAAAKTTIGVAGSAAHAAGSAAHAAVSGDDEESPSNEE